MRRDDYSAVKLASEKAAEFTHANWRKMPRKDAELCKAGLAFDKLGGGVDIVLVPFTWTELETISKADIAKRYFDTCYKPDPRVN